MSKRVVVLGFRIMPILALVDTDNDDDGMPIQVEPLQIPGSGLREFVDTVWPAEIAKTRAQFTNAAKDRATLAAMMGTEADAAGDAGQQPPVPADAPTT